MDTDRGYHVHYLPVLADIGSYVSLISEFLCKIIAMTSINST
jgi:hypothetical protein